MIGSVLGSIGMSVIGGMLGGGSGGDPAQMADPFASQRPQYQGMLQQLMTGNFTPDDPSYKFRFNQGLEGVNRATAAQGQLMSGNRLAALTEYGQNFASQEYNNQYQRLAQLAGANIGSPSGAAYYANQQNQQMAGLGGLIGGKIGGWLDNGGWSSLFGGGGGDAGAMNIGSGMMSVFGGL